MKPKKIIYYDGACPMCTAIVGKIGVSEKRGEFSLRDITKTDLPAEITREAAKKEIHAVEADGTIRKNADALLSILETYPGFSLFSRIGRWPGIKQILATGYRVVAVNRYFIFGETAKIFWIKITLSIALIAGLFLSMKLWISERWYPSTPFIPGLPLLPFPLDQIILWALVITVFTAIFSSKPRRYIAGGAALLFILGIFDQSRWQPWAYQYFFMLIPLGLFSWKSGDAEGSEKVSNICRLIIGSMYFWSGLQKIGRIFPQSVLPWLVGPQIANAPFFPAAAALVPFIEIAIGLGLLTKKFRNPAVILAIAMHLSILAAVGPFRYNWNSVIWPWNLAMIAFITILFWKSGASFSTIMWKNGLVFQKLVLVLFGIMPLFSFFGIWDSYLSSSLYSGNTTQATIRMSETTKIVLPPQIQSYMSRDASGAAELDISRWSFSELNVPAYPEARIYKNAGERICALAKNAPDIVLTIKNKAIIGGGDDSKNYFCPEL